MRNMQDLEQALGYRFRNAALLREALRHSSYANEHHGEEATSNERLEFLGDSVLGFVTAEYLFAEHPDAPEGELTRIRARLVCEGSLYEAAKRISLGEHLCLGRGEDSGGGRERPSILADATEAVIAAVYLDGGIAEADALIHRLLLDKENEERVVERRRDYKTALQELVQRKPDQTLCYRLSDERGPDHAKVFTVAVLLNGETVGEGTGRSKKEAEQMSAKDALERLTLERDGSNEPLFP
jgi:ribonuclease-3